MGGWECVGMPASRAGVRVRGAGKCGWGMEAASPRFPLETSRSLPQEWVSWDSTPEKPQLRNAGADTSVHLAERTRNGGSVRETRRACKVFFQGRANIVRHVPKQPNTVRSCREGHSIPVGRNGERVRCVTPHTSSALAHLPPALPHFGSASLWLRSAALHFRGAAEHPFFSGSHFRGARPPAPSRKAAAGEVRACCSRTRARSSKPRARTKNPQQHQENFP